MKNVITIVVFLLLSTLTHNLYADDKTSDQPTIKSSRGFGVEGVLRISGIDEITANLDAASVKLDNITNALDATVNKIDVLSNGLSVATNDLSGIASRVSDLSIKTANIFSPDDDQFDIQEALNDDGYVYLLPGEYTLTDTLVVPRKYGCALIGMGGSTCYVKGKPISPGLLSNGAVIFKWAGPPDKPMIKVLGSEFRIDGIVLKGPASIGLLINNEPRGGMGPGKGYVPYLTVCDCDVAVQAGVEKNNDNGDVTSFGRLTAYDCGTIFKAVGLMAFEFHFEYVRNARCSVVFDCLSGGGIHCNGGQTLGNGGTLLRLSDVNPVASTYCIRGWHVDAPAAESGFKLLECTNRSWADVTIQAHLPQKEYSVPIANLVGPVSLTFDGCSNLLPNAVAGVSHNAGIPVAIASRCRLRGDWVNNKLLTGDGSGIVDNCFLSNGKLIEQ